MLKFSRLIWKFGWIKTQQEMRHPQCQVDETKHLLAFWSMEAPNKQASTCLGELAPQTRPRNTRNGSLRNHNLVGGFNPSEKYCIYHIYRTAPGRYLKNISQLGWLFPIYGKKCSKPPTSNKFDRFGWMIAGFLASPFLTTLKIGGSPRSESLAHPWLWVRKPL